jgi:hypothetical protein
MSQTQTWSPCAANALAISLPMPAAPAVAKTRCIMSVSPVLDVSPQPSVRAAIDDEPRPFDEAGGERIAQVDGRKFRIGAAHVAQGCQAVAHIFEGDA